MQQRVNLALKLDPDNDEALIMQVELLTLAGQDVEAQRIVSRLCLIKPEQGARAAHIRDKTAAERAIKQHSWQGALVLIDKIVRSNQKDAHQLLFDFLGAFRSKFPVMLIDPSKRKRSEIEKRLLFGAGLLLGLALAVVVIAIGTVLGDPPQSPIIALAVVLGTPYVLLALRKKKIAEFERNTAVVISDHSISENNQNYNVIRGYAESLYLFTEGKLLDADTAPK